MYGRVKDSTYKTSTSEIFSLSRVLKEYEAKVVDVKFEHVSAHVCILVNKRADSLAEATVNQAIRNVSPNSTYQQTRWIKNVVYDIVINVLAHIKIIVN